MGFKKDLIFSPEATDFYSAFAPNKISKFVDLETVLNEYLIDEIRLGQNKKLHSIYNFLKSDQFKKLELDIETEQKYFLIGFVFGFVMENIRSRLIITNNQQVSKKESKLN